MSLANNDANWRLVAAEDIPENCAVTINGAGKAAKSNGTNAVGICVQPIKAGERCPVIRHGKLGGLVGFSAGTVLHAQATGLLAAGGAGPALAVVVSEDATCAVILSANLDQGL